MKPLVVIGYIAYLLFAIVLIGLIPNFFFRFVALVIFVAPVLRKLFMPKTVYNKYNKLLRLFNQTHRNFQITRNEPEVVEFTLKGFEKDSIQYGSIVYPINAFTFDSDNFIINSKSRVCISLHTTCEGRDVHVEKTFHHSYNQTLMFNEIIESYTKKVIETINNSLDEEDNTKESNIKENDIEDKLKSKIIKTWSLLDFAREFGPKMQVGEFINSKTQETFKSCIFIKDNTKTYVAFNSKLGELTPKEIVERKNSLIVVQVDSGIYSLCEDFINS